MTLAYLSQSFEILSWMIISLSVGWTGYRIYSIFILKKERDWIWESPKAYLSKFLKTWSFLTIIAMLLSVAPVLLVFSPSRGFVSSFTNWAVLICIVIAGLFELGIGLTISKRLTKSRWKKGIVLLLLLLLNGVVFSFFFSIPNYLANPKLEEGYAMALPIEGIWSAAHAGESPKVNYHSAYPSQRYGVDIVKVDERGRFFQRKGQQMDDFFTYQASIFAPISGRVIRAVNHLPNAPVSLSPNDTLNPAGNHVVIQFAPDRYVFLAHLHPGSVTVAAGDSVETGELLGLAGNSGNTSWPHLHIHVQDKADLGAGAKGYPFYFQHVHHKRWISWSEEEEIYLLRNDRFSPTLVP